MYEDLSVKELLGKTLVQVEMDNEKEWIRFRTDNDEVYKMYHEQDCCESVTIETIYGDLGDLIGRPIVLAQEITSDDSSDYESSTWTFYDLATNKGTVTIRWYGESNGYYSESVDFIREE